MNKEIFKGLKVLFYALDKIQPADVRSAFTKFHEAL